MKDVVAMTRAQAESRGHTPHPDCDPSNPERPAAPEAAPRQPTVYLDGSRYYHRKTCSRLKGVKDVKAAPLETAGKEQWPCPDCKPPVRQRPPADQAPAPKPRGR